MTHIIPIQINFTLTSEPGCSYSWSSPLYPFVIFATPYYDNTRGISWEVEEHNMSGNLTYIDNEAFWALENGNLQDMPYIEHPAFLHYVDFMTTIGLPRILKCITARKEQI